MLEALRAFIKLRTISVDPAMKEQCWSGARFLRRLLRVSVPPPLIPPTSRPHLRVCRVCVCGCDACACRVPCVLCVSCVRVCVCVR
jgi:hypothetical protein